ncbi:MAG: glycosyltransferase [Thermoleophilia bacterium]
MSGLAVSVIVPVHGLVELTRQCLTALLETVGPRDDLEVIVVDDASPEDVAAALGPLDPRVRVVRNEANLGFARACNAGAAAARGRLLLFLNNDTVPLAGWLEPLLAAAGEDAQTIVGARLLHQNGTVQHAGIAIGQADRLPRHPYRGFPGDHPAVTRTRPLQAVTGACLLVARDAFERLGGFDATFVNGFEDVDLCLRLRERGGAVVYCGASALVHLEAATRGADPAREAARFRANADAFLARWGDRLVADELALYAEDGLLVPRPGDLYPLDVALDARLGVVDRDDPASEASLLLNERARQVFDLLKENARLRSDLLAAGIEPPALPTAVDQAAAAPARQAPAPAVPPPGDLVAGLRAELVRTQREIEAREEDYRAAEHEVRWRDVELEARGAELERLRAEVAHLKGVVEAMRATGAWRAAERFWALRRRLASLVSPRRRSP